MAYPIVAQASTPGWISAQREPFTYRIRTTVPNSWIVACGDSHRSKTVSGEQTIFECDSDVPREHIEVAAAKFRVIEDAGAGLRIYALPQDAQAAQRVLGDLKRARIFFGNYFRRPATGGYTVIEIPEGWGSQASAGYCIQTPDAFRDPAEIAQLYHELAHSWNAEAQGKIQRARYFDEAFASYFAALAIRQFSGADAFASEMERLRLRFISLAKRDKRYITVVVRPEPAIRRRRLPKRDQRLREQLQYQPSRFFLFPTAITTLDWAHAETVFRPLDLWFGQLGRIDPG